MLIAVGWSGRVEEWKSGRVEEWIMIPSMHNLTECATLQILRYNLT